jgi:Bacterial toxin homologue of phage lysozyme, C-term
MELNEASVKLILEFEVGGGKDYYNRLLKSPIWPGEASGVTIGVGYDLGYNSTAVIQADWSPHLDEPVVQRLLSCAGKTGQTAKAAVSAVKDIVISWDAAFAVYQGVTIPKFCEKTRSIFPGFDELHPNCQGALVSLVFNRGESLQGPRRTEMRAIKQLVPATDYRGIAQQMESMKRLWIGTSIEKGMSRRRDAEAALILSSLDS